jgi:uncharacterized membrane protein YphA (DoxX/SURF4 family)
MVAARIALAWVFIYYGAGKLFGAFNGPGIHRTALYFSGMAHLLSLRRPSLHLPPVLNIGQRLILLNPIYRIDHKV